MSNCCDPLVVNVPGTPGDPGAPGDPGVDGVSAFTLTTAAFTIPAGTDPVTLTVAGTAWLPASPTTARFTLAVGAAGYFTLLSYSTTTVTVRVLSAVAVGTVIPSGQRVSVAGAPGQAGTNGTSGATADATYLIQTAETGLPNAQVLADLTTGYAKVTTTTGVVSTVSTIPVGDIVGNWDLTNTTGTIDLTTKATGVLPLANGGTQYAAADLPALQAYLGITAVAAKYFARSYTADVAGFTLFSGAASTLFTNAATTGILDNASGWNASGYYVIPNTGVYRADVTFPYNTYTGGGIVGMLQIYQGASAASTTPFTVADGFVSSSVLLNCVANDQISVKLLLASAGPKTLTALAGGVFQIQRVA
jgi:hypothetical protein